MVWWKNSTVNKNLHCAQPDSIKWSEHLPIVLLGFRLTIKEGIEITAAEMVYGKTLRWPREFFTTPNQNATSTSNYASRLRQHIAKLSLTPTRVHSYVSYLLPNINVGEFIFVRPDTIKYSLQPNYNGTYKVFCYWLGHWAKTHFGRPCSPVQGSGWAFLGFSGSWLKPSEVDSEKPTLLKPPRWCPLRL